MIQDIGPHKFDIAYQGIKPDMHGGNEHQGNKNKSLIFTGDKVLVKRPLNKSDNKSDNKNANKSDNKNDSKNKDKDINTDLFDFPTYAEIKGILADQHYLFRLDDVYFFRGYLESESMIDVDKLYQDEAGRKWKYEWQVRRFFRTAKPKELALAGITGLHLNGWYLKNKFCGACGAGLVMDSKERMMRCPACGSLIYPRINPAVIVGVTDGDRILLTKYRGREYKKYALVAGFTEIGESFEETVRREVMEETGLRVKNIRYYKSQPWGFTDNILAGYYCEADGDTAIRMDSDELSTAEWVRREDIDVAEEDLSLTNEMICRFKVDIEK